MYNVLSLDLKLVEICGLTVQLPAAYKGHLVIRPSREHTDGKVSPTRFVFYRDEPYYDDVIGDWHPSGAEEIHELPDWAMDLLPSNFDYSQAKVIVE